MVSNCQLTACDRYQTIEQTNLHPSLCFALLQLNGQRVALPERSVPGVFTALVKPRQFTLTVQALDLSVYMSGITLTVRPPGKPILLHKENENTYFSLNMLQWINTFKKVISHTITDQRVFLNAQELIDGKMISRPVAPRLSRRLLGSQDPSVLRHCFLSCSVSLPFLFFSLQFWTMAQILIT